MKRFNRSPAFEQLEDKRLKAADLATDALAHGPAFVETADASTAKTSLTAEESGDNKADNNETDATETDGTDTNDNENDSNDTDSNDNENGDSEFTAPLKLNTASAGSATVEMDSEDGTTQTDFKIKVTGAPAGDYTVAIDSTTLTGVTLTVDAQGNGELELSSEPDDDEQTLPDNFPKTITPGTTTITLTSGATTITGTFATSTDDSENLTALQAGKTGSSQSLTAASFAANETATVASDHSVDNPLTTTSGQSQNLENDSPDLNILDAGFAATAQPLDSWKETEFQPHYGVDESDADGTPINDALFDTLLDGEIAWIV